MNMLFNLVGGSGLKGEFSPSILILVSSVSTNAMKALFGRTNPLALALEVAFCGFVRIWHVLVDERDGELGPRGVISVLYRLDELFFDWETGGGVIPEKSLASAR